MTVSPKYFNAKSVLGVLGPDQIKFLSDVTSKLQGVEEGATADQSNAEIEAAYNAMVSVATQAEAEAGALASVRRFTPERIAQAIEALGTPAPKRSLGVVFDGGGSPPTAGSVGYVVAQFSGTIDRWDIIANASGDAVVDVWKLAGAIPTDANRIAGTEKPTLSAAQLASDVSLTTWSTLAVAVGDVLGFELESVATVTRVTCQIRIIET